MDIYIFVSDSTKGPEAPENYMPVNLSLTESYFGRTPTLISTTVYEDSGKLSYSVTAM
jgi:hypothetical protein